MTLTKHQTKSRSQEGPDEISVQPCPVETCGPQLPYYRLGSNSLLGKNDRAGGTSTTLLKKMNNPWAEITLRRKEEHEQHRMKTQLKGCKMGDRNIEEKVTPRVIPKM